MFDLAKREIIRVEDFGVAPLPPVGGKPALHAVEPQEQPVWMDLGERVGHTLVLGTTRVGKTRLAELLISQDIRRGDVVIVFDDGNRDHGAAGGPGQARRVRVTRDPLPGREAKRIVPSIFCALNSMLFNPLAVRPGGRS